MMTDLLTPYLPSLLGGVLIGLAAGGLFAFAGKIAGVSSALGGALLMERGAWRWAFIAGLVAAGIASALAGKAPPAALIALPPATAIVSGLLVGFGSRLGSGCTSGHGVCGIARLSPRSLVAVAVFMLTAAATVFVVRHPGWIS